MSRLLCSHWVELRGQLWYQAEGELQAEAGHLGDGEGLGAAAGELGALSPPECRDVLLPLLIDQLSGQLDDNSSKPDHEASSQLLSNILEVLDRKDVVS